MFFDFKVMGRLTQFPDYKATGKTDKNGNPLYVCNISVAVNKGKNNPAEFYNLTAFGDSADFIHKYFTKGQMIYADGHIKQSVYEKDGKTQRKDNYIIDKVKFCGDSKTRTQDENQRKVEQAVQQAQTNIQSEWATAPNEMPMDDTLPF